MGLIRLVMLIILHVCSQLIMRTVHIIIMTKWGNIAMLLMVNTYIIIMS